ncbi:hypothetical protein BSK53_16390, partial [Paenibacillus odorifer]
MRWTSLRCAGRNFYIIKIEADLHPAPFTGAYMPLFSLTEADLPLFRAFLPLFHVAAPLLLISRAYMP